jgi:hypothetical protein
LAFGSHHSPFAHCAELTAGVAIVTAAIGANAITMTGLRTDSRFFAFPEQIR